MPVSIYYKLSLFNAHTMILIVHIFMNVNKLCLNEEEEEEGEEGVIKALYKIKGKKKKKKNLSDTDSTFCELNIVFLLL